MKLSALSIVFSLVPILGVSSLDLLPPVPPIMSMWPMNIRFHVYNPRSDRFVRLNALNSLIYLSPTKNTVLIIHGWHDNHQAEWIQELARAYHESGQKNYLVLSLDWSRFSRLNYMNAAMISKLVGNVSSKLLLGQIKRKRLDQEKLHLIGNGMGAQIAGFMGKRVKNSGYVIDRITALDAANFIAVPNMFKLNRGDANFIDFIHNDIGLARVFHGIGNVDFFVDSPCNVTIQNIASFDKGVIAKKSSYNYYIQSLKEPVLAVKCANYLAYKMRMCSGQKITFGEAVERNATGSFFLESEEGCKIIADTAQSVMKMF